MTVRSLIVGGIVVPLHATLDVQQSYQPQQAVSRRRVASGSLHQRVTWTGKLSTTIVGSGSIPAGLSGLDYTQSLVVSCVAHRAISSTSPNITLPAARRSDAGSVPYGRAQLMAGNVPSWVATPVTMAGNVAQLTPVAGAVQYQAVYFPELTVFADPPTESKNGRGPAFGWQLIGDEL